jgi:group I intron endonuclease
MKLVHLVSRSSNLSDMRQALIYHLFNTVTGEAYVGSTWGTLEKRWGQHCRKSFCVKLWAAIQKYGPESFVRSVLTQGLTTPEDVEKAEGYWADYFDCFVHGYNVRRPDRHAPLSAETRAKMSIAKMGKKHGPMSLEQKLKLSRAHRGKILSEEHKKHIGDGCRGKKMPPRTPEHCQKLSDAKLGKAQTPTQRLNSAIAKGAKPFVDQNGVRYEYATQAARLLGVTRQCVSLVLRGLATHAKGYTFKYI